MQSPTFQSNPQDDISVVMGRFHAWDAIQKGEKVKALVDEVRELSYEEALAAHRPSRHVRQPSTQTNGIQKTQLPLTAQKSDPIQSIVEDPREKMVKPAQNATAGTKVKAKGRPVRKARSTVNTAVAEAQEGKRADQAMSAHRKDSGTTRSKRLSAREGKQVARFAECKSTSSERMPAKDQKETSAKSLRAKPTAVSGGVPPSSSFRSVLTKSLKDTGVSVHGAASTREERVGKRAERSRTTQAHALTAKAPLRADSVPTEALRNRRLARTISVNLRLSAPEHARMRTGAAAAGVTVASFIRESGLQASSAREYERKVAQGHRAAARITETPVLAANSVEPARRPTDETRGPGLLSRMKRFWLGNRQEAIA